jgi:valyl-tRNA synthetase
LANEQQKVLEQIERSQKMLNNEQFVARAKPEVVERERKNLADLTASAEQIAQRISKLCRQ